MGSFLATLAVLAAGLLPTAGVATADSGHHHHRHGLVLGEVARPKPARPTPTVERDGPIPATAGRAPALVPADKVALRPLVIGLDAADFGLPTWKAVLDRTGSPYDVLLAKSEPLTPARLVNPDGTGRYSAILLTDNALLYPNGSGDYVSAFDTTEWRTLWGYEAAFRVRQVSLFTSWGTFPEDYCLRPGIEGGSDQKFTATLTGAGSGVFDYLKPGATIPITDSYVYRSALSPTCKADPLLKIGNWVVGVTSTSADGRERAALTFTSDQNLAQTDLLGYGLLRWATRGVLLGESRHWINVDLDDLFNYTDHLHPDGRLETDPGFRMSGTDLASAEAQQRSLRSSPQASDFTLNLPYNGSGIDPEAPSRCSNSDTPDPLTSYARCLSRNFRWLNHTVNHPELNFTDYPTSRAEIGDNLKIGRDIGLTVPTDVLKTPAYSGLGVYNPDPDAPDTDPPTDFGLGKSNKAMLDAAYDVGVRYLHGNMSFPNHVPKCFNCGINHPLRPELLVVPDWPTNIGYHTTAPAEQTLFYNSFYGPNGKFPFHDHDLTYNEMVDYEAEVALHHVMSGSAYAHTLHQGNLRQYASGRSLTFDWLKVVVAKYSARYQVPLLNPDWPALAKYVKARNGHFAELAAKRDPVWNKADNTITFTAATTGSLFLTGATAPSGETDRYGTDRITRVPITAGGRVVATAVPRR
ncbi:hypothetical protein AB0I60_14520 [Actinosynnema sp. NPDC050436]|uniref:Agd3-related carbohydrate-binding protein n=1 Tax=Actinosynnema sp. NPDC050436 TaxID=3155659 RepID=UPI0033E4315C